MPTHSTYSSSVDVATGAVLSYGFDANAENTEGLIDKSPFYKFISCTEKGKKYYDNNIYKVIIPESYFSEKRLDLVKIFLGLKRPS